MCTTTNHRLKVILAKLCMTDYRKYSEL